MSEFEANYEVRESEAKAWLQDYFAFDDSRIDSDDVNVGVDVEGKREKWRFDKKGHLGILEAVKAHPDFSVEEVDDFSASLDRFGRTNNFWNIFQAHIKQNLERMLEGDEEDFEPAVLPERYSLEWRLYYWVKSEKLMKASEEVGFQRVKEMIEAIEKIKEHESGTQEYSNLLRVFINTLRNLMVKMYDQGVPIDDMTR